MSAASNAAIDSTILREESSFQPMLVAFQTGNLVLQSLTADLEPPKQIFFTDEQLPLAKLNKEQLREKLKTRKLSTIGSKDTLIRRLETALSAGKVLFTEEPPASLTQVPLEEFPASPKQLLLEGPPESPTQLLLEELPVSPKLLLKEPEESTVAATASKKKSPIPKPSPALTLKRKIQLGVNKSKCVESAETEVTA
jgi:hypothetical protein